MLRHSILIFKEFMNKTQHKEMIESAIKYYQNQKYQYIKADHLNFQNTPDEINGNVPDITCYRGNIYCVAEIETVESYNTSETLDQLRAFSEATNRPGCEFHVIVPASVLKNAKNFAQANAIRVDRWLQNSSY